MRVSIKKWFVISLLVVSTIILVAIGIWKNNTGIIKTTINENAETKPDKTYIVQDGKKYKRKSYVKAILVLGIDSNVDMHHAQDAGSGGQADSIGLIAWDTANNRLDMIIIPRDTMTQIPVTDVGGNIVGKTLQHITMAYAFGDGNEISGEFMKEAVSELFEGLTIDQYLSVNTSAIKSINDAIGGVELVIPYEGMEKVDASFVKGEKVLLKGDMAEKFLRYRDTARDFSAMTRIEAHKVYLAAYQKKLRQFKGDSLIENILKEISPYYYTDMQKDMILKLAACAMADESFNEDRMYVLEGENKKTEIYDEFYMDRDRAMNKIIDLFYTEE